MKSKSRTFLKRSAFCAFLIVAAFFGQAFYLRYKTARMHSQCSVLTAEINNEISNQGDQFKLESYLASIRDSGLGGLVDIRGDGVLLDAWGNPLLFEWEGEADARFVIVRSVGRDGIQGTTDDFWRSDIAHHASYKMAEQGGYGQPATRPKSQSEGSDKPQPESEGRSR